MIVLAWIEADMSALLNLNWKVHRRIYTKYLRFCIGRDLIGKSMTGLVLVHLLVWVSQVYKNAR
jgi:hypothetical protein